MTIGPATGGAKPVADTGVRAANHRPGFATGDDFDPDAPTIGPENGGVTLAGRYRILRQLGQGGMGSVYLAEDMQLDGKLFAIKMLPSVLVANKVAYRQLKDEALVAMKLTHPNIATLRAFEENRGNPFLVMDYIEGKTLDACLAEWGSLSAGETATILAPVAAALDYAHSQNVVHRDVKPANVIVRKDGVPFVLDFGIAREIQETMTRVTGKLSSGTLLYMSPEQLHGRSPKPAQDVYSFAAMAYECMKGEPPFVRGQIEYQIDNDPPEPLPGGSPLAASVMAGLAKRPEDRPPSCMAMLEGTVPAAQGAGAGTSCDTPLRADAGIHAKPARPKTGLALSVAAVAGIALLGGWYGWRKYKGPEFVDTKMLTLPGGATMEMIYVEPGTFTMGSPGSEDGRFDNETQHSVTLTKGFWLGKYEVTQAQWKSVMGDNPSCFKGDDLPVENVSWDECQEFCRKVNEAAKLQFGGEARLPTEAEWEYACRAGSTGAYSGTGNLDSMGWYYGNSGNETHPVGQKRANDWGFYDMHGNVWEWCSDWYGEYPGGSETDPKGPASGGNRVLRGGSWNGNARSCRSAYRDWYIPGYRNWSRGFRLACSAGSRGQGAEQ